MSPNLKAALKELEAGRQAAAEEVRLAMQNLQRFEQAIKGLKDEDTTGTVDTVLNREAYKGMGIRQAAERYLIEVGRPAETREIADALKRRGIQTTSKDELAWVRNVFASLYHKGDKGGAFERVGKKWTLAKKKK
jgi:hypothetical protein